MQQCRRAPAVVMVQAKGKRIVMFFLLRLGVGGKHSCCSMAFSTGRTWIRAPVAAGLNFRSAGPTAVVGRPTVHHAGSTRPLCSVVEAVTESMRGGGASSGREESSRKTVVVARGKARLFW